jgi:hypothetical protein
MIRMVGLCQHPGDKSASPRSETASLAPLFYRFRPCFRVSCNSEGVQEQRKDGRRLTGRGRTVNVLLCKPFRVSSATDQFRATELFELDRAEMSRFHRLVADCPDLLDRTVMLSIAESHHTPADRTGSL